MGAVFLGLSVCQSGLRMFRRVALLARGMRFVPRRCLASPPSPAWNSPICPYKTSLPGLIILLGAQTTSGCIGTAPQTPVGPGFMPQLFHQDLAIKGWGGILEPRIFYSISKGTVSADAGQC